MQRAEGGAPALLPLRSHVAKAIPVIPVHACSDSRLLAILTNAATHATKVLETHALSLFPPPPLGGMSTSKHGLVLTIKRPTFEPESCLCRSSRSYVFAVKAKQTEHARFHFKGTDAASVLVRHAHTLAHVHSAAGTRAPTQGFFPSSPKIPRVRKKDSTSRKEDTCPHERRF